jgi:hypothetical protein
LNFAHAIDFGWFFTWIANHIPLSSTHPAHRVQGVGLSQSPKLKNTPNPNFEKALVRGVMLSQNSLFKEPHPQTLTLREPFANSRHP